MFIVVFALLRYLKEDVFEVFSFDSPLKIHDFVFSKSDLSDFNSHNYFVSSLKFQSFDPEFRYLRSFLTTFFKDSQSFLVSPFICYLLSHWEMAEIE